ncbi:hypothetical protein Q3G72_016828 [Acer saccharum]|nr:hypothetical protein Q3G72_016828 [Acer saccharum]
MSSNVEETDRAVRGVGPSGHGSIGFLTSYKYPFTHSISYHSHSSPLQNPTSIFFIDLFSAFTSKWQLCTQWSLCRPLLDAVAVLQIKIVLDIY